MTLSSKAASNAIGEPQDDDYKLRPRTHAEALEQHGDSTAPLVEILRDPAVEAIVTRREQAYLPANAHKRTYTRLNTAEIVGAAAAGILAALLIYIDSTFAEDAAHGWRQLVFGGYVVSVAAVAGAAIWLNTGRPYELWQKERSAAETCRVDYFEAVCEQPVGDHAGAADLLLLQLEYFARYQLVAQMTYYRDASRRNARINTRFVAVAALTTAIAAGAAAMLADTSQWPKWLALIGIISPIVLAATTNLAMAGEFQRNAARYRATYDQLVGLQGELGTARKAAEVGDAATVHGYMDRVSNLISAEHRQWLARKTHNADDHD